MARTTAQEGIELAVSTSCRGVEVITLRDGLVASKDTHVDALAVQRQMEAG